MNLLKCCHEDDHDMLRITSETSFNQLSKNIVIVKSLKCDLEMVQF